MTSQFELSLLIGKSLHPVDPSSEICLSLNILSKFLFTFEWKVGWSSILFHECPVLRGLERGSYILLLMSKVGRSIILWVPYFGRSWFVRGVRKMLVSAWLLGKYLGVFSGISPDFRPFTEQQERESGMMQIIKITSKTSNVWLSLHYLHKVGCKSLR